MATEEEIFANINFMANFITEIESFNDFASRYIVFIFDRKIAYKELYNIDFETEFEKVEKELPNEEKTLILNILDNIRKKATMIYFKYIALKTIYNFENIEEEYRKLFDKKIIDTKTIENFTNIINKAYLEISKELIEVRKKYVKF